MNQEKIISFEIESLKGVSVTQGYGISNSFPVHFHASYNLGIIELGERNFFYRGENTLLKPDDVFIVQPFEPHFCKTTGIIQNYKMISFSPDKRLYFPDLKIQSPGLSGRLKEFHSLATYEKSSIRIVSLFSEIMELLNAFSQEDIVPPQKKRIAPGIVIARKYIEVHCHEEVSLKEMAETACLSEFHFNRYFHQYFGLSPYAYYLVCKLKKAQKVLMKQRSVIETTYDTGFFDQSHFTRLFKKHIGVTPGKFLKDNCLNSTEQ